MTVSSTDVVDTYNGDGSTTGFDFTYAITDESDLVVQLKDADDDITTQTITTHYTVSGTGNSTGETNYTSGTVTFVTAPEATEKVIIKRSITANQDVDLPEYGAFPAETVEDMLDKLAMGVQEANEKADRAIKLDPINATGITAEVRTTTLADKYIKFNAAGTALEATGSTTGLADIVEDTTPQLGGQLDANGNDIQFADGDGIVDDNSNELVTFQTIASAVNYLDVSNAATGNNPILKPLGDDTNVGLDITPKGSGGVTITSGALTLTSGNATLTSGNLAISSGTATASGDISSTGGSVSGVDLKAVGDSTDGGQLQLFEDTDNGSNFMALQAPAAITTSTTLVLPDGDGSADQVLKTNGSGTLSWTTITSGISNVVEDTTPQLGGTLDMNSNTVTGTITTDGNVAGVNVIALGDSSGGGEIRLGEDTDNGSNYMALKAPASVTSDVTLTLPDGDGSADQVLKTNGSGTLSWTTVSGFTAASQAEQEAGSDNTVGVTPANQHHHTTAAKCWVSAQQSGTQAINASYNVTSIADGGNGTTDVTIATDFSSTEYCIVTSNSSTIGKFAMIDSAVTTAGAFTIESYTNGGGISDSQDVFAACYGDQ